MSLPADRDLTGEERLLVRDLLVQFSAFMATRSDAPLVAWKTVLSIAAKLGMQLEVLLDVEELAAITGRTELRDWARHKLGAGREIELPEATP